ncbi:MAG: SLC13 family permease, partial [Planctomycetota bacterium]
MIRLLLGPLLGFAIGFWLSAVGHEPAVIITAAVVAWTAVWWMLEPIPIAVTSLLPLAIFPLSGVLTQTQVAEAYGNHLVLLLMGGFILSTAMQRSGTHRRLALMMVHLFGGRRASQDPADRGIGLRRVVFGFMVATAVLSMWISNAATTLMMLPIAMAVLESSTSQRLSNCLLLGIAFAASIGGIGTPIGTPPNMMFIENYALTGAPEVSFAQWMMWMWPIIIVMLPIQAIWLTRGLPTTERLELPEVGQWRSEEIRTLAVFGVTALLWITRVGPLGGWSSWLAIPQANDACVAFLAIVAMH